MPRNEVPTSSLDAYLPSTIDVPSRSGYYGAFQDFGCSMVAYCTRDDVLGEGVPATVLAFIDADYPGRVDKTIATRSAYVETRLKPKWEGPYATWDATLSLCVAQLVAYDLMSIQYGNAPPEGGQGSEKSVWRQRYDDAQLWLDQVRDGRVVPNITDATPAPALGEEMSVISTPSIWSGGGGRLRI